MAATVERLRAALAAAGLTDTTTALTMAGIASPVGQPAPRGSARFLARADQFLAALEIGLQELRHHRGDDPQHLPLEHYTQLVEFIGSGQVHTLAGLRYLEDAFLTFWHEGPNAQTHGFWEQVRAAGLPYERTDHLGNILARGRIASSAEHDVAVDSIVLAQQDGRLSPDDATRLSTMIGSYERRRR